MKWFALMREHTDDLARLIVSCSCLQASSIRVLNEDQTLENGKTFAEAKVSLPYGIAIQLCL